MKYRNLIAEMARKGMSREGLLKALNSKGLEISYATVSRQLNGESDIPLVQAKLLSEIFGVSIECLLDTEGIWKCVYEKN